MRIGAANSVDVQDVDFAAECVTLAHRPDQGTRLKNGNSGERLVALTADLTELLKDHVEANRHDVTDDYGREPLMATNQGRMHRKTMRRMVNRVTAPCFRNKVCPDC